MICPHRSEYIGKPKQRYSTPYDPAGASANENANNPCWVKLFTRYRNIWYGDDLCSNSWKSAGKLLGAA